MESFMKYKDVNVVKTLLKNRSLFEFDEYKIGTLEESRALNILQGNMGRFCAYNFKVSCESICKKLDLSYCHYIINTGRLHAIYSSNGNYIYDGIEVIGTGLYAEELKFCKDNKYSIQETVDYCKEYIKNYAKFIKGNENGYSYDIISCYID